MASDDLLELRRETTLSGLAADRLEKLIVTRQLAPGQRINEVVLARELGISRGPLREGLRHLASRGLVEFIANKGAFVRDVDAREMLEIYDLRSVLTGHACRRAAELRSQAELEELERRVQEMDGCVKAGDAARYYELNLAFHDCLLDVAGGSRLAAFSDSLAKEAALFRRVSLANAQEMAQSNAEHAAIVAAIRRSDGVRARKLGEAHVLAGKSRFEKKFGGDAVGVSNVPQT
jgi:DNA-binding GntR family transcriptional regulator